MKKVLLVGKFSNTKKQYTYASSFFSTLKKLGYNVTCFNVDDLFLPKEWSAYRGVSFVAQHINNAMINKKLRIAASSYCPDVIFVIKATPITSATMIFLRKRFSSALFIFFHPDNMFVFWNENSNSNILKSLPLYDHVLSWSKMLMPVIESAGARTVHYFPFAYDEDIFHQEITITIQEQKRYKADVVFVGTWSIERERLLTKLVTHAPHVNIALWGNRWHEMLPAMSPLLPCLQGKAIYHQEMIKAFRCAKIVLNMVRPQNFSSHNMRTFEVLASKAFMLTQRTAEQTMPPFEEGKNVVCFSNVFELIKKIDFYLNNDRLRRVITHRGFILAQEFTLYARLDALMRDIDGERKAKDCNFVNT